jgi:peptidyl-prolyl cis-trans isomerase SurA
LRDTAPIRCLVALAVVVAARGEIIDRIAASVGNRVITASDLDRQLRVAAFQDGVKADLSPTRKRAAVEAMIEQKLIQAELANSRYPLPDPAELAPAVEEFKKAHFKDDRQYRATLAEYGIGEDDFRELLLWQRTLLLFIEVRFETGVQLGTQDVEEYFAKTVKPAAEAAHPGQPVSLDDYREQIGRTLTGQRADQQMDIWLRGVRSRANVVVHDEVLK